MTRWTNDQRTAIEARGGDLLVSAAAGSGKTAVVDAFSCLKLLMCGLSLPAGAEGLPKRALIAYGLGDTGKDFALAPEIR